MTCTANGRCYYGISKQPHQRFQQHLRTSSCRPAIRPDLHLYGSNMFHLDVLHSGLTQGQAMAWKHTTSGWDHLTHPFTMLCMRAGRPEVVVSGLSSDPLLASNVPSNNADQHFPVHLITTARLILHLSSASTLMPASLHLYASFLIHNHPQHNTLIWHSGLPLLGLEALVYFHSTVR